MLLLCRASPPPHAFSSLPPSFLGVRTAENLASRGGWLLPDDAVFTEDEHDDSASLLLLEAVAHLGQHVVGSVAPSAIFLAREEGAGSGATAPACRGEAKRGNAQVTGDNQNARWGGVESPVPDSTVCLLRGLQSTRAQTAAECKRGASRRHVRTGPAEVISSALSMVVRDIEVTLSHVDSGTAAPYVGRVSTALHYLLTAQDRLRQKERERVAGESGCRGEFNRVGENLGAAGKPVAAGRSAASEEERAARETKEGGRGALPGFVSVEAGLGSVDALGRGGPGQQHYGQMVLATAIEDANLEGLCAGVIGEHRRFFLAGSRVCPGKT